MNKNNDVSHVIPMSAAGTLDGLFRERVRRTPDLVAYKAYKLSLDGKEAPVIDGLTGDQRFFLSFAQTNRTLRREEALRNQILTDPHSPDQYRVNGIVRNVDAWYEAFNVTPGDDLYLPPEERVHIW